MYVGIKNSNKTRKKIKILIDNYKIKNSKFKSTFKSQKKEKFWTNLHSSLLRHLRYACKVQLYHELITKIDAFEVFRFDKVSNQSMYRTSFYWVNKNSNNYPRWRENSVLNKNSQFNRNYERITFWIWAFILNYFLEITLN
jgi:hypothetical protein